MRPGPGFCSCWSLSCLARRLTFVAVTIGLVFLCGTSVTAEPKAGKGSKEGGKGKEKMVGKEPKEIYLRLHNPGTGIYSTLKAPNKLHFKVLNDYEAIVIPDAGALPFREPGTRNVCFMSWTCTNPACAARGKNGRPFVFPPPVRALRIGKSGEVEYDQRVEGNKGILVEGRPFCPLCNSQDNVKQYMLPEVEPVMEKLTAELASSRKALREARQENRDLAPDIRPPVKIQEEIKTLPWLFLKKKY